MAGGTGAYTTACMLDVDAVLDGDFGAGSRPWLRHQIPFHLWSVGKAFRILKNELHGHDRRAVVLIARVSGALLLKTPFHAVDGGSAQ